MLTKSISWKKMENVQGIFFREVISFLAFFNKAKKSETLSNFRQIPTIFPEWSFFPIFRMIQTKLFFSSTKNSLWISEMWDPSIGKVPSWTLLDFSSSSLLSDWIRLSVAFFFFPLDLDPDSSSSFIQFDLCH